ncbi:MAG TPA: hypothetical protein VK859_01900 [bacterium]|nr:hypothetical protein [bacterium]
MKNLRFPCSYHPDVVYGKSLSAKGKGVCYGRNYGFLVAVSVKSFDFGITPGYSYVRGTKADLYPLIEVNAKTVGIHSGQNPKTVVTDLEISFVREKVKYPKCP